MMLVDFGNTFIKWVTATDLAAGSRADSHSWEKASLTALLDRCWANRPVPERVVVGSVAGAEADAVLRHWVERQWGRQTEFLVTPVSALGVVNAYLKPAQLGIDRWAALVAAHHIDAGCNCVVDIGTALTCDVVTADGQHRGGLICPGLHLMRGVLAQATDAITESPDDPRSEQKPGLGTDTRSCVAGGTLAALVGLIHQALEWAATECGAAPKLILCGGDAEGVRPLLFDTPHFYEPDLVLKGLALLARQ